MKTRLLFDHLPKTAGTSLIAALERMVGESGQLADVSTMHHRALQAAGDRRLIAGHLWFAEGEPLAPDWYYCTVLREPVERFLSQYSYNRAMALATEADAAAGEGL